jgi:hypothetical protein
VNKSLSSRGAVISGEEQQRLKEPIRSADQLGVELYEVSSADTPESFNE